MMNFFIQQERRVNILKFELRKPRYYSPNSIKFEHDETYHEAYITKGEFIKNYENSSEESYSVFSQLVEMYTTPHCFHREVSFTAFQKIYENLKSKSKYKGITLGITVEYDYSINKLGQPSYDLCVALIS